MSTVMEKDVLIEEVSSVYVLILRKDLDNMNDLDTIKNLRDTIYQTEEKDIDFDLTLKTLKDLRKKYE